MKEKFTIAAVSALACFAGGCVSVDSEVAPAPSRYWKAPQDAGPRRVIQPEDIKTDKIASPEDGGEGGAAPKGKRTPLPRARRRSRKSSSPPPKSFRPAGSSPSTT